MPAFIGTLQLRLSLTWFQEFFGEPTLHETDIMIKTLLTICLFLFTALPAPAVWAGFEEELADTGKADNTHNLRGLRARAEAGNADSQLNMGGLFFKGEGVAQDYAEATKWFLLAARQGHAQAQFNLGMMYATGQGVAQDHAEAAKWYRISALQGLAVAQLNLGVAYAIGQGVLQNESEAAKWTRLAAVQGEAQAQFNLGVMYANGQGVEQNFPESYRWAKLATAQGHETARALMNDLARQMTPDQVADADNDADNTVQKSPPDKPAPAIRNKSATNSATVNDDVYLQLGAFRSQIDAEIFMAQIRARLGNIGKPISLFTADGWVRIHAGPYTGQSEARRGAGRLKTALGFEPMIKRH